MAKYEFLYLSEDDLIRAGVLDGKRCFKTLEDACVLVSERDYLMGGIGENEHGLQLFWPNEPRKNMLLHGIENRFMAMPCYLGGRFDVCGCKWYGANTDNRKKGLPILNFTLTLNDKETGLPIAFMAANPISAMRTGTIPGIACKYLAPHAESVGIIGCGMNNKGAVRSISIGSPNVKEIKAYDIFPEIADKFASELTKETGMNVVPVHSIEEAVEESDFIHYCAAGAQKAILKMEWLKENAVVAISHGIDHPEELLTECDVVLDRLAMHEVWREREPNNPLPTLRLLKLIDEGVIRKEDVIELPDIVAGKKTTIKGKKRNTVFLASGMTTWDIAVAFDTYKNAEVMGIGTKLPLWNEECWH